MRPIDADFCKSLGATCITTRNKNGDLVAIASIDLLPTMYKCETCVHNDDHPFDEPCIHCDGGHLWVGVYEKLYMVIDEDEVSQDALKEVIE